MKINEREIADNLFLHAKIINDLKGVILNKYSKVNVKSIDHIIGYLLEWFV